MSRLIFSLAFCFLLLSFSSCKPEDDEMQVCKLVNDYVGEFSYLREDGTPVTRKHNVSVETFANDSTIRYIYYFDDIGYTFTGSVYGYLKIVDYQEIGSCEFYEKRMLLDGDYTSYEEDGCWWFDMEGKFSSVYEELCYREDSLVFYHGEGVRGDFTIVRSE